MRKSGPGRTKAANRGSPSKPNDPATCEHFIAHHISVTACRVLGAFQLAGCAFSGAQRVAERPRPDSTRGLIDHALVGALDIIKHRRRHRRLSELLVTETYNHSFVATCGFGRDPMFAATRQDQQAALRSHLFERGAQKCASQVILHIRPCNKQPSPLS